MIITDLKIATQLFLMKFGMDTQFGVFQKKTNIYYSNTVANFTTIGETTIKELANNKLVFFDEFPVKVDGNGQQSYEIIFTDLAERICCRYYDELDNKQKAELKLQLSTVNLNKYIDYRVEPFRSIA